MSIKKIYLIYTIFSVLLLSCTNEETLEINEPETYTFNRGGETTVSFPNQTTYIAMAEELSVALGITTNSEEILVRKFAHEQGEMDFSDENLNISALNIKRQVANSVDFFSTNISTSITLREGFDDWITEQVAVFSNTGNLATSGTAGFLTDIDGNNIYFNEKGVALKEVFTKSLIGAVMVDQILNNYLSSSVLDTNNNIQDNDDTILVSSKNYTAMEHEWDNAYGFLYGAEQDLTNPTYGVERAGADSFLNRYVSLVDQDEDFAGIAIDIFNAFKLGRAAIVAKDYDVREEQAEIIKEKISKVIAIRAVYGLQKGKHTLETEPTDFATAFNQISEALGFIYSLQFTRQPNTTSSPTPYYTKTEVEAWFSDLLDTGDGLWQGNIIAQLDKLSTEIIAEFDFTILEAYNPIEDQ